MKKSAVLFFVLFAISCSSVSWAADKLKLATLFADLGTLPIFVGVERGTYQSHGIKLSLENVAVSNMVPALMSGDIDMFTSTSPGIIGADKGLDMKIVMALSLAFTGFLVVTKDINSLADLKGKKVAIQALGLLPHRLAEMALKEAGVDPSHVTFVAAGNSPNRFALMKRGEVAAGVLYVPYNIKGREDGFKILLAGDHFPRIPEMAVWMRNRYVREEPDIVRRFIQATLESTHWLSNPTNASDAVPLVKKLMGLKSDEEAKEILGLGVRYWSQSGRASPAEVKLMAELLLEKKVDPKEFCDFSLVPAH